MSFAVSVLRNAAAVNVTLPIANDTGSEVLLAVRAVVVVPPPFVSGGIIRDALEVVAQRGFNIAAPYDIEVAILVDATRVRVVCFVDSHAGVAVVESGCKLPERRVVYYYCRCAEKHAGGDFP